MKTERLEYHPLANLFPIMDWVAQGELAASIRDNGLLEPIVLYEGRILDGRHRYMACLATKTPLRVENFTGPDPLAFVVAKNLSRRHLDESQRGVVAAKLANMKHGGDRKSDQPANLPDVSQPDAAKLLNVSERTVRAAKQIQRVDPERFAQVERGEITIHQAQQEIRQQKLVCDELKPADGKPTVGKPEAAKLANKTVFNQTTDSIEWAKWTWNPVTGCKHGCPYCYARDIANRFNGGFEPEFHSDRLTAPDNMGAPKAGDKGRVFVCSMADLFGEWVPPMWIEQVLNAVRRNPQWTFLFLSKNPARMAEIQWPKNAWVGTTVDTQARVKAAEEAFQSIRASVRFVSCEPLLERITFKCPEYFDWYIVGGRSRSNELPEFQPEWEWVEHLLGQVRSVGAKIYFKPNLKVRPTEDPEAEGANG